MAAVITAPCPAVALTEPDDDSLLTRFAAGERGALEVLFRRYRQPAYRVAYRLLSNEADALDAVQEGFVKALTHLPGFQGRSSFKTWLLRVVSNAALDLGRQRGRRETLPLDGLASAEREALEPVTMEDPAARLENGDLRRHLQDALRQLPEAQRRTFVLHVEGGLSYREVADVLKISIGTVMSRLYYARQKLKGFLN